MKEDHYDGQHDSNDSSAAEGFETNEYQDMKTEKKKSPRPAADPQVKCSHCGTMFFRSTTKVMPFCSVRCQQIDMGRWLDEEYSMPIDGHEDRDEYGTLPDESEDNSDQQ